MNYSVKFKTPQGLFYHTIRDVTGDTIIETDKGQALPVRVFFLADKSRVEIPMSCIIRFSKERFFDIQAHMSAEAGQNIPIN